MYINYQIISFHFNNDKAVSLFVLRILIVHVWDFDFQCRLRCLYARKKKEQEIFY